MNFSRLSLLAVAALASALVVSHTQKSIAAPEQTAMAQSGEPAQAAGEKIPALSAAELLKPMADDAILGDPNAPVTIIEYASLSCPHCAHFHAEVLPQLEKNYIETGKVKFISRPFPLNEPALRAAQIAACAGKDKYHAFLKVFFSTQEKWVSEDFKKSLTTLAGVGGMGQEQVDKCLADTAVEKAILISRQQGADTLKIESTPTFFVEGKKLEANHKYEELTKLIDPILAKAKK